MELLYERLCPVCGGPIEASRLRKGLPCRRCSQTDWRQKPPFSDLRRLRKEIDAFARFFEQRTGRQPWKLQQIWAGRLLLGQSFSMTAPTGTGKTTFGMLAALYKPSALVVVPSIALLEQIKMKFPEFAVYHSRMKADWEEVLKASHLAITTNMVYRRIEDLEGRYDLIFYDDIESMVRSPKSVEMLLRLAGYSADEVKAAWQALKEGHLPEAKPHAQVLVSSATIRPRYSKARLLSVMLGFNLSASSLSLRKVWDRWTKKDWVELVRSIGHGVLVFVPAWQGKEGAHRTLDRLLEEGISAISYEDLSKENMERFQRGEIQAIVGIASSRNPLARGIDLPETVRAAIFTGVPAKRFSLEEARARPWLGLSDLQGEALIKKAERRGMLIKDGFVYVPDHIGYLQASGRTSRLYGGGLSPGLSIVFKDSDVLLKHLERRCLWYVDMEFKPLRRLDGLLRKLEAERRRLKQSRFDVDLNVRLVIVESPRKAKTLSSFFGAPALRLVANTPFYEVSAGHEQYIFVASQGHLFDLVTKKGYHGVLVEKEIIPIYDTIKKAEGRQWVDEYEDGDDKKRIIDAIKSILWEVDEVFISTDPDAEGEKIAHDLYAALRPLKDGLRRLEIHAITRRAFLNALSAPREITLPRVLAQVVRRVADRWVGFELSQYLQRLWNRPNLSAGRVQTPVLRWIVERHMQSKEKIRYLYVEFNDERLRFEWPYPNPKVKTIRVEKTAERVEERKPRPPLTTDELLQEGSRMGFTAEKTMRLAQDLFESGLITYHRTDSTRVAPEGISLARRVYELLEKPYFRGRTWGEGGAHECIRPTRVLLPEEFFDFVQGMTGDHLRLYARIFWRFIESQGEPSRLKIGVYKIWLGDRAVEYEREIDFDYPGCLFYRRFKQLAEGEFPARLNIKTVSKYPPYTEAQVIALMKERNLGRPSTYAKILENLKRRGYVMYVRGYLIPTKLAYEVLRELQPFEDLVSEEFTRQLEEAMDKVELGEDPEKPLLRLLNKLREKRLAQ